jgi:hypothetical protein
MSLLHKVRVLVGALVHKPFAPRPERVDLDEGSGTLPEGGIPRDRSELEGRAPQATDTDRVADLIAQRQQEEGG